LWYGGDATDATALTWVAGIVELATTVLGWSKDI
jgi:hypothetical protein